MHSFCTAKNQAECHYRPRQAPFRTLATRTLRLASSYARIAEHEDDADRSLPGPPSTGPSFWRTGSDAAAAAVAAVSKGRELGGGVPAATSSGTGDGRVQGVLLPLKRLEQSQIQIST